LELAEIYKLVEADLAKVNRRIDSVTDEVDSPHLSQMLKHTLGGGKIIRPTLTLLSAKLYDYDPERLLPMAVAVELLHTATLVHDDAIDKSAVRRGKATVNAMWGEERAVLLGDYIFARAGEFAADTGNLRVVKLFSQTLRIISGGEIVQINDAFDLEQSREHYLERIANKTASLFVLSTVTGAILSRAPEESITIMRDYGFNLGVAFQIVDDILDFVGTEKEMGKPIGSDLTQGTLTLPAMLLLDQYPADNPIKEIFGHPDMPEKQRRDKVMRAIEMVSASSIGKQCYQLASDYCDKACDGLDKLPASPSRQALQELAALVISRKK
jgi:geranylgeranyl pyrophosphate synthase